MAPVPVPVPLPDQTTPGRFQTVFLKESLSNLIENVPWQLRIPAPVPVPVPVPLPDQTNPGHFQTISLQDFLSNLIQTHGASTSTSAITRPDHPRALPDNFP